MKRDLDKHREWIARSRRASAESLKRSTELARTPIRKVNRKRRSREFARAYGSEARVRAIKALPCSVPGCRNRPCENAHTEGGGMGRKAGWDTVVPLCMPHHMGHHRLGSTEAFDKQYGTDLKARAAVLAEMIQP